MWSRSVAVSAIAALVLGVGAVAPAPFTPQQLMEQARNEVLQKVYAAAGLNEDGEVDETETDEAQNPAV